MSMPEARARELIDRKLAQAGWLVQDMRQFNLGAATGVAVRECPTDTGPADYVLFVNRQPVGVIEAKRDEAGENITAVEEQTFRYANASKQPSPASSFPRTRTMTERAARDKQSKPRKTRAVKEAA